MIIFNFRLFVVLVIIVSSFFSFSSCKSSKFIKNKVKIKGIIIVFKLVAETKSLVKEEALVFVSYEGKEYYFYEGDFIPGIFDIKEIFQEKVCGTFYGEEEGAIECLNMEGKWTDKKGKTITQIHQVPINKTGNIPLGELKILNKSELKQNFMKDIRFKVTKRSGLIGLKVSYLKKNSPLFYDENENPGGIFLKGDVVTHINNVEVTGAKNVSELQKIVVNAGAFLTIIRKKEEKTIFCRYLE